MQTLFQFMTAEKMTQRQLAARLDLSVSYINELLRGSKVPSLHLALRIQRETGVPVDSWPKPPKRVTQQ